MFQTVPLSIIRSLFTVHSAMVYVTLVCREISSRAIRPCSKTVYKPVWHTPLLSVQWINWWWTEELSETCRVSHQNKFVKLVHLVGFIIKKFVTMHGHTNIKKVRHIFAYSFQEECAALLLTSCDHWSVVRNCICWESTIVKTLLWVMLPRTPVTGDQDSWFLVGSFLFNATQFVKLSLWASQRHIGVWNGRHEMEVAVQIHAPTVYYYYYYYYYIYIYI